MLCRWLCVPHGDDDTRGGRQGCWSYLPRLLLGAPLPWETPGRAPPAPDLRPTSLAIPDRPWLCFHSRVPDVEPLVALCSWESPILSAPFTELFCSRGFGFLFGPVSLRSAVLAFLLNAMTVFPLECLPGT